jgi:hypothetical protein
MFSIGAFCIQRKKKGHKNKQTGRGENPRPVCLENTLCSGRGKEFQYFYELLILLGVHRRDILFRPVKEPFAGFDLVREDGKRRMGILKVGVEIL